MSGAVPLLRHSPAGALSAILRPLRQFRKVLEQESVAVELVALGHLRVHRLPHVGRRVGISLLRLVYFKRLARLRPQRAVLQNGEV